MQLTIDQPDSAALAKHALATFENAFSLSETINSDLMYEIAGRELRAITDKQKQLDEQRKAITRPLDDAKARVMALFDIPLASLADAKRVLSTGMLTFHQERMRIKAEEEARLAETARKVRERLQAEAQKLEVKGKIEQAESKRELAAVISAPLPSTVLPAKGAGTVSTTWRARITDRGAFLAAIATQPMFHSLVDENASALNQLARSTGGRIAIAGVECYEETRIAAARSRA